ncbi:Hypothetical protein AA314_05118 [Archangium gephyra]|uniref:Uncharacterized protein n=1 Tax=Archangium gephyra TaxID=48 RepID=A0AAC8TEZ9_9BACT|nr:Hypothetical protein AA314_05118 [Archangium gephyra]
MLLGRGLDVADGTCSPPGHPATSQRAPLHEPEPGGEKPRCSAPQGARTLQQEGGVPPQK